MHTLSLLQGDDSSTFLPFTRHVAMVTVIVVAMVIAIVMVVTDMIHWCDYQNPPSNPPPYPPSNPPPIIDISAISMPRPMPNPDRERQNGVMKRVG